MTVNKLIKLEDVIKPILEESEQARNDDFFLYCRVLEKTNPESVNLSMLSCFMRHKELGLPSYESISRVRRKVQEKHPELESEKAKKRRMKEEYTYKEYSKIS